MNIYASVSIFTLVIILYWVISEFFTLLFKLTGLPSEKAGFQVMSLLTGCGYTTKESETFVSSKSRRRIAKVTMLFGYVFNITIVSALINVFLSMKESQIKHFVVGIFGPLSTLIILIVLIRTPAVHSWVDGLLEKLAGKVVGAEGSNTALLMDYIGSETIVQVRLNHIPDEVKGLSLADLDLKNRHNIMVMLVESPGRKAVAANASTVFELGDKITVFGNYEEICRVFDARERFAGNDN
ncbi:MAG: hypothetical protein IJM17_06855 [Firmicutes bacterium]|nr:hypothetical protein [Bacillota bacterium]